MSKTSTADAFQVRSASEQRLVRRLGSLPPETMDAIGNALKIVLELQP